MASFSGSNFCRIEEAIWGDGMRKMFLRHLMTSMSQVLCRTRWHLFLMIKTKSGQGQKKPCHIPTAAMYFCFSVFFMGSDLAHAGHCKHLLVSMLCRVFGNELSHRLGVDRGDFLLRYRCVSCEFKAWLQEDPNLLFDIWVWHVDHWCFSMLVSWVMIRIPAPIGALHFGSRDWIFCSWTKTKRFERAQSMINSVSKFNHVLATWPFFPGTNEAFIFPRLIA